MAKEIVSVLLKTAATAAVAAIMAGLCFYVAFKSGSLDVVTRNIIQMPIIIGSIWTAFKLWMKRK